MQLERFAEVVDQQMTICRQVLTEKSHEYATQDQLHNFKVAAELTQTEPREALGGMMVKHTVSIYDMIASPNTFSIAKWNEKITDHINYLLLLKAVVIEELEERADKAAALDLSAGMKSSIPVKAFNPERI